jgi:DNA oxidative demethylase
VPGQLALFPDVSPALPVPGLGFVTEAVDPPLEADLQQQIDATGLTPFEFGQWEGKRLTVSYGSAYDFTRARPVPAPPLPDWLAELRARLAPQVGRDPTDFAQALLIRYDPGAGIGWHRDRPQYGEVIGLSLGAPAVLRLRRRVPGGGFERTRLELPARSLYLLSGEVRSDWEHSIVPQTKTRWSVTFRTLRESER